MERNTNDKQDRLEDFIRGNRDSFDDQAPPPPAWLDGAERPDRLERFVRNNRKDFDHLEPSQAVWNDVKLPAPADLELYVLGNRSAFDVLEPSDAVWEKIQGRLESAPKAGLPIGTWIWRAASVAAILLCVVTLYKVQNQPVSDDTLATTVTQPEEPTQELSPEVSELLEAEAYYAMQVNHMKAEFDQYAATNPDLKDAVEYDLEELDKVFLELKEELNEDLHNQEIIEAMIQNYRLKLQVLEDMLLQIRKPETNPQTREQEQLI